MINNEILSFIKDQVAQGATKDQVKNMLVVQGGWDDKDVEEAFETINFSGTSYPSVLKNAMAVAEKIDAVNQSAVKSPDTNSATNSGTAFAPASDLMKSVANDIRPVASVVPGGFSPGLSHREQPKSMEPSAPTPVVGGSSAFGDLRARIASGVSGAGPVATTPVATPVTPVSVFQPIMKEPMAPAMSSPMASAPNLSHTVPSMSPASKPTVQPPVFASNNFSASTPFTSPLATPRLASSSPAQPSMSPAPSFGKMPQVSSPMPSVMSPIISAPAPSAQPVSIFPKSSINTSIGGIGGIGGARGPSPAQLAALQKKQGGRFLLGLLMFLIGIAVGGISMNAYMKGYINKAQMNSMIDKVMDKIGLGTVTAPPPTAPASDKAPVTATAPATDEGS